MPEAGTRRSRQKSDRRSALLAAAERLIAEKGFLAVRLEDIGAAAGVSGPVELLVGISTRLLAGAQAVVAEAPNPGAALDGLIEFHLDFALGESDLIRIQDRDLDNVPTSAQRQVRRAQRSYVEVWVSALRDLDPQLDESDARLMAHAVFGLLNSTPHSMKPRAADPGRSRDVLWAMTVAAVSSAADRHPRTIGQYQ